MRKNFAQNIRSIQVNAQDEYDKLREIYTEEWVSDSQGRETSYDFLFCEHFRELPFAGTHLTLDEFTEACGYSFDNELEEFQTETLIDFCEFFFNLISKLPGSIYRRYKFHLYEPDFVCQHILRVIDAVGYMRAEEDGFAVFVPKDSVAIAVSQSEKIPVSVSYRVLSYNHHSMKGDLENKRQTLLLLANQLEPQRKVLETIDKQFASDLFYAFNNFHIRHNNVDPLGTKYKKPIGDISDEQLECWYDEVYQMCLLAFMRLEHRERKKEFDSLKAQIEGR